jgi:hypothetical protein
MRWLAVSLRIPPTIDASKTGIGIAWAAQGVDLDLYVRPFAGVTELYYARARSREGFLYADERDANAGRYYEFVELKVPVDLKKMTVWVNFYAGRAANITGQVVLFDHGRVRTGTFAIRANRGNHGSASSSREQSPYWTRVQLDALIEATAPLAAQRPVNR